MRQAQALYQRRTAEIRNRWKANERETWASATRTVALSLSVVEATAILNLLALRPALCSHDRLLAEALAKRLGVQLAWNRKSLLAENGCSVLA